MKLYNTLTRKKENFVPISDNKVKIYACGPTVYNYIHIGNARPICVFDVLRRFLRYIGYEVVFAQNFTDIDDKIIKKANEENLSFKEVAEKYIKEYKIDVKGLNVLEPDIVPKATENIEEMLGIIKKLIEKNHAYALPNGDVYFKTRSFANYGALSLQTIDDLKLGARIETGDEKQDPLDFALWKSSKPGEPFWESEWGRGRPGWHIECSAMVKKFLGETIDIHCGGQDLIFPHHENEIAQSECANGVKMVNFWLHNGYINVDNKKMSKSSGNFFTIREIADVHGYEPIRYMMISAHYRTPINFSEEVILQCKSALERLYTFRENLIFACENNSNDENLINFNLEKYENNFEKAMNDDLNTADALGVVFEFVREVNAKILSKNKYNKNQIEEILNIFNIWMEILGILNQKSEKNIDYEIEELIKEREIARKNKNWALADEIRDKLKSKNILIEDTAQGAKIVVS